MPRGPWSPEAKGVAATVLVVAILLYLGYKALPKLFASALEKENDELAGFLAMFMGLFAV